MALTLTSPVFRHGDAIPQRSSCEGDDVSPPLKWTGIPAGTKSPSLIVNDPDAPDPAAPKRSWVHWVLYNLPVESTGLAEGVGRTDLPAGTLEGLNDWKKPGYGGPCPPVGKHRSFFKLYALAGVLEDLDQPTKQALEKAMQGHMLAEAELMGVSKKHR